MIRRFLITAIVILSSACGGDLRQGNYNNIKVVKVIDGDTVMLSNGKLLRYIGIDCPEMRINDGDSFIELPQPYAQAACDFNRKMVEGKSVKVEFDVQKMDKYGRLLGYCFTNNTLVNARLLEEGLAVLYTYPPNVKYLKVLLESQARARNKKAGIWSDLKAISPDQAHNYIDQIGTVKGRVLTTYKSAKCTFLNFGRDYKNDFTVVIFPSSYPYFNRRGINPEQYYRGRVIEVTGRIRRRNGPEIIVNIPDEIGVDD